MPQFHPESPDVSQDSLARLRFIADFRKQMHAGLSKGNRGAYERNVAASVPADASRAQKREIIRAGMEAEPFFRGFSAMLRASQDLMWRLTGNAVDADQPRMAARLAALTPAGSVAVNPDMPGPAYITGADIHRMPGGYMGEDAADDLRAGALYDLGGAVYQLGVGNAAGGLLNDSRGRTLVAHLATRFPDFAPTRILDMGCGVGHNTVPLAAAFPAAETFGIDVGAALVRYAHLRAEGLGVPIHFVQDDAEHTQFPDASFDLVVSQIILHETSPAATAGIIAETRRLLRPGGIMIHLEVPLRAENGDDYYNTVMLWEEFYNAEPNISGVMDADFIGLASAAGFTDVKLGYQAIPAAGAQISAFTETAAGFGHWLVLSGVAA
jgi:SAM-dependent methyltransferase